MLPPILSIVIPTHNRTKYAYYSVKSILSINSDQFELVISDTSENNTLEDFLEYNDKSILSDFRLKYFKPSEKLNMTGNHNFAMSKAQGEYVCLIGDDDTVTNEIIDIVKWLKEQNIEILSPTVMSNYVWPDFKSLFFGMKHASRLYLPKKIGSISSCNSKNALLKSLGNATQGTDNLPKIYHGIVKRTLLNELYLKTGNFFHGSSPDVSGAIGLSLVSNEFVIIEYPVTIPGASGGSNTGRSAMNKHKGKLENESQTSGFLNAGWSKGVPRFFSVETVWAHAALETIRCIDHRYLKKYNYSRLLGICKVIHKEYKKEIDIAVCEAAEIQEIEVKEIKKEIFIQSQIFRFKRLIYIIKRITKPTAAGGRKYYNGIQTIYETPKVLSDYLDLMDWNFKSFISKTKIEGKK